MDICSGIKETIMSNLPEITKLRNSGRLKSDKSFVSEGDLLCQSLIFDWIRKNIETSCIIVSEETDNDLSNIETVDYVITIDPIDGTENFVSGLKEWGVGVSVYYRGTHYQSMILLPELDICLATGDKIEKVQGSRICGLSSYMTPRDFEGLDMDYEYRIMGCCMYNMYNVIKGCYRQFQHLKGCYSWDILPGLNLALEHELIAEVNSIPYTGQFLLPDVKYKFYVKSV